MSEDQEVEARLRALEERVAQLEKGAAGEEHERSFEVIDVDGKTTGQVGDQVRLSWKIRVRNLTDSTILFSAKIFFVDMNSFTLEEVVAKKLRLSGDGEPRKFSGFVLVDEATANAVMGVKAHLWEEE